MEEIEKCFYCRSKKVKLIEDLENNPYIFDFRRSDVVKIEDHQMDDEFRESFKYKYTYQKKWYCEKCHKEYVTCGLNKEGLNMKKEKDKL